MAARDHECAQVTHNGKIVWACLVDPVKKLPPERWRSPAEWSRETRSRTRTIQEAAAAERSLFERLRSVLPTLTLGRRAQRS